MVIYEKIMPKETIKKLATILDRDLEVEFNYRGFNYEIFYSESNDCGWMIEIHDDGVEVDGGLCTGSAYDAIEFML